LKGYIPHVATTRTFATEDDLLQTPEDGQKYELVDGEILVSPGAGARHGRICVRLMTRLDAFVSEHKLGYVLEGQTGFRIPGKADHRDIRIPDLTFVAAHRFPEGPPSGFPDLAPDLAVEVLSPSDRPHYVLDKIGQLLDAGSRLVWVIDPEKRTAAVYRSHMDVRVINESGSLEGEDVIPGFSCPVSEILV
jgi:Uma2 family endonuclease